MNFSNDDLNSLFHYCLALTGQRADAQDLLHTAVEKFLRHKGHVDYPLAYIRRSARNHFYDQWRRQQVVHFEALSEPERVEDLERDLESMVIDQRCVAQVCEQLTAQEREVIFLWAVEGLSASEIALQLSQPRGTVLSRLHRLRLRLCERFPHLANGGGHE